MNNNFFLKIKNIAIIGLSDKKDRPSYQVAKYLQSVGFNIYPVNPNIKTWEGFKAYDSIKDIPQELNIDVWDFFVKSERVFPIVEEIIKSRKTGTIWLQEGIENKEAEDLALKNGFKIFSNMCMMKKHKKESGKFSN